jgi:Domain of unknown function (DUF5667)
VLAFIPAFVVAGAALPGDPLYPLKRMTEHVRLTIAVTPERKAVERTRLAVRRCEEFERLATAGDRARLGAAKVEFRRSLLAARAAIAQAQARKARPATITDLQLELAEEEQEMKQFGLDDRPIDHGTGGAGG